MGLEIKSMYKVLKDMIDWTTARSDKLTDFNIGSGIRTLYEAVSIQIEEIYFRMKQYVLYAIETSIYTSFGIERKTSEYATGTVNIVFQRALTNSLTIPKGTIFSTSDMYGYIYFETTDDNYCEPGLVSTTVEVKCQKEGAIGNVPQGAISLMIPTNQNVKSVYNTSDFTNGREAETALEHKKRCQKYMKTLAKATRNAIMWGALQVEGVTGAYVDDNYIGYVKLYVHNSDGELPAELKSAVNKAMIDFRAGGIEVEVLPIVKVNISPYIKVMLYDDYDTEVYEPQIKSIVFNFLNEYSVGDNYYLADVIHHIKSCYEDIVINVLIKESEDTVVQANELIRPGNITIECINKKNWRNE